MKKLIIVGLVALLPLPSLAVNFSQTPFELLTEIKDNRKAIFKIWQNNYCTELPAKEAKELSELNSISTKDEYTMDKINRIVSNRSLYRDKCSEAERGLLAWEAYKINPMSNFSCGPNYIKRGELCLTPTETCQFYFGKNVSGQDDISAVDTATCVCDDGYELQNKQCVPKPTPQVAGVSIVAPTNAELQAQINQLLAIVQALVAQLTAMGR